MTNSRLHIVFSGGGTAGHLFPGLAVARELAAMSDSPRITFAGSGKNFEVRQVVGAGFQYLPFRCAPAATRMRSILRFLRDNFAGYRSACRFLSRQRPNVVVGLGGFASVPMVRAAISLDIPLVLLEQNAYPGKVTRWVASRADLVCAAFEEVRHHLPNVCPIRIAGNPLRPGFVPRTRPTNYKDNSTLRLLVLGGSGGAHSLNEALPRALYKLARNGIKIFTIHQTGAKEAESTWTLYQKLNLRAKVIPFINNLSEVLNASDLVVCRSGGSTMAELAAMGVPAILVPYSHAADDHQRRNAEAFVNASAASMVLENDHHVRLDDALATTIQSLANDRAKRNEMAAAMLQMARPDAAWHVAVMIHDLAYQKAGRIPA